MSNGNGVKSVSLANGTLSPDLRVNYQFGLVLGVNEFEQEQEYFLQKDYLYNRAFQGYGTVSGLAVTAKWLKGEEVEITVSPGMAIDQFGRPVVVREALCARLTAWLQKQEKQKKGTIEAHRNNWRRKKKHEKRQQERGAVEAYSATAQHEHGEAKSTGEAHSAAQHEQEEQKSAGKVYSATAQDKRKRGARKGHHDDDKRRLEEDEDEDYHDDEDDERDLRVYIIARYDYYADGQVPIAGQACNSSDTQPVYSRIHDFYTIDFSWDPPGMPAWDSVRCFAKMMAQVRIKADTERNDTEEIIEQMRKLDKPGSIALCAPPGSRKLDRDDHDEHEDWDDEDDEEREPRWYIPAAEARESLDRIFRTWVTEVRPNLLPNLLDPTQSGTNAQPDILLAHLDFTLDDDWEDNNPKIEEDGFDPPDNAGRPFLLPTQVEQELLLLGHRESERIDEEGGGLPQREFATIQVRNSHSLYGWVHHPRQLKIESDNGNWGEVLEVRSNGQALAISHVTELEPNFFEIRIKAEEEKEGEGILMVPGARVELVFKVDEIHVEPMDDDDDDDDNEDEGKKSGDLGEDVEEGVEKVGEVAEQVVQGTGDVIEEAAGGIEEAAGEVVEDVGKGVKAVGKALRRATGVGRDVERAGARIERAGERVEGEGQELITAAQADERRLDQEEKEEDKEEDEGEHKREIGLGRSIRRLGIDYVGYDPEEKVIIVYTIANHIPVRELVTFFVYDQQSDIANAPHTELRKVTSAERFLALWFHTDQPVRVPSPVRVLRTFVDQEPQELLFKATAPGNRTFSWFWALEPQAGNGDVRLTPGELLTVIFNSNEMGVGGEDAAKSLTEVMKEEPFTCIGYDGNHTIKVYRQVHPGGGQSEGEERTVTDKLEAGQPPAGSNEPTAPAQPFVTVSVTRLSQNAEGTNQAHLELWFHLSTDAEEDRIGFTENLTFDVLVEEGQQTRTVQAEATSPTRVQHNVYTSVVTLPAPNANQRGYYLRLRFRLDANPVTERDANTSYDTLREYIRSTGIRFEGYNGRDAIIAYIRTAVPSSNMRQTSETAR